jgi:menaquinone-dependent protoporphyrinogen oxidase
MARILIAFASYHGQTARIAERIATTLSKGGHAVDLLAADAPGIAHEIGAHDAVMVGAAVHMGRYRRALERFARENAAALDARPNAFFSVCLGVRDRARGGKEAQGCIDGLVKRTGWHPHATASIAGALAYSKYNPFLRQLMRLISRMAGGETDTSRDYEYTDWDEVEAFALAFAARLDQAKPPASGARAYAPTPAPAIDMALR